MHNSLHEEEWFQELALRLAELMRTTDCYVGTDCEFCTAVRPLAGEGDNRRRGGQHTRRTRAKNGSLVIPEIHNPMIFMANKECPYKSRWIL
jgi:hypothetical protein